MSTDNRDPRQAAKLQEDQQRTEITKMESQLKATTRELKLRLDYLDQLAREHEAELARLKASPFSPQRDQRVKRIEQKLNFYRSVKQAAMQAESTNNSRTAPLVDYKPGTATPHRISWKETLGVKTAEAQAILAGARILMDETAPKMKVVQGILGRPGTYSPSELTLINRIKPRAQAAPSLTQRLSIIYQQYSDALAALQTAERAFQSFKSLEGREALQYLTQTVRASLLAGKLYPLERLHIEYAGDPDLKLVFPPPEVIDYPTPASAEAKPPTPSAAKPQGGLMGLFSPKKS